MPVYIYNNNGLLEERADAEIEVAGREISTHNRSNPVSPKKLFVGPSFPPPDHTFDSSLGTIRLKSVSEKVNLGEFVLPPDHIVANGARGSAVVGPFQKLDASGRLVDKTAAEKIAEGLQQFDSATEKIENDKIVPKSRGEMLTDGSLTYDQLRDAEIKRLRLEVEFYFDQNKTTNGYRLDNLARQKAALTMLYRALPDTDPTKADLLTKQLIYTDAICDEILAKAESVQSAYSQAKAVIQDHYTQQKTVAEFEAVKLTNYIV